MIVAGLDLATTTGIAILERDRLVHWQSFRPRGDANPEIFHGFRQWLWSVLVAYGVQYAAIEEPLRSDLKIAARPINGAPLGAPKQWTGGSSMATYLRLYGIFGHAQEICHALNIPCEVVNQSTWRKSFCGNGRATKEDAVAACKRMGWTIPKKDPAEACGVAFWLQGELRLQRAQALASSAPLLERMAS